jgi:AbrB family looped-hinge helix DNA binding protein
MHNKRVNLIGAATVGTKGQIVIPIEAREFLGIKPGDKVFIVTVNDKKVVGICPISAMQAMVDQVGQELNDIRTVLKAHEE